MAHKKAGSTTKKNRDSIAKRLGVKLYGGQSVEPGNIIIRQRGNKFYPGIGVRQGNDHTLYAISAGKVSFKTRIGKQIVEII